MNKERIIQLLESTYVEDIILGVHLSYKLPLDEFKTLYQHRMLSRPNNVTKHYIFKREGINYIFGRGSFMGITHVPWAYQYTNLTPEEYHETKNNS